jgi:transcription initiation factor TFIID TATA-box-binding protein
METNAKTPQQIKQEIIDNLKIISISAQFSCGRNINIDEIQKKLIGVKYNPKRNWSLSLPLKKNPKATMQIFNSGKVSCFGTKTIEDAKKACKKCAFILKNIGYEEITSLDDFKINYVTCSNSPLPFGVDLDKMGHVYVGNSSYDPSIFPALMFTVLKNPTVSAKIFSNGNVTINGAKTLEDAKEVYKIVYDIALKFKIPKPVTKPKKKRKKSTNTKTKGQKNNKNT